MRHLYVPNQLCSIFCSHRKATSIFSIFWRIYYRCLYFYNCSFGLAVPFGLLHSFIEFPISAIFSGMYSLFGGWAIYSCTLGFGLDFHIFYGNTRSIIFLGYLRTYSRFSISIFFEGFAMPFGGCAIYSCIFGFWLDL